VRIASAVWESDAGWASFMRVVLSPPSALYRGVTELRNALYDRGTLSSVKTSIPVLSVGNLSVGGTGKTPVSAWLAGELKSRGAHPAVVMRGYGDDEPRVHALLNPGIPVFANANRVAGVRDAATQGADVAVLDDGFQHRSISRCEDLVLVSADRWREPLRVLPAGPWRELPSSLVRASLVMVTRKAAERDEADSLMRRLAPLTRTGRGVVTALELGDLCDAVTGTVRPLSDVGGTRVLLVAGVADPRSLVLQLRNTNAHIDARTFPDHYSYTSADVMRLASEARSFDRVLCTLKDAVKLGPQWPREAPTLWYVSLRCRIESGSADVSGMLDRVLAARPTQL
jgi:tetraacyldisaccharide 4'-kinase